MSKPGLLLDEMFSGTIAAQLRARGFDAIAVVEDVSLVSTPDEDLLIHATTQERALVTANVADFVAVANDRRASGRVHCGIIYITHRAFPQDGSFIGAMVEALARLCESATVPQSGGEAFLRRE